MPAPVFDAFAVNVTEVPAQIAPMGFAVMFTVGITGRFTSIVMTLEFAVFELRHVPPVTVIEQDTALLFASVVVVKLFEALL